MEPLQGLIEKLRIKCFTFFKCETLIVSSSVQGLGYKNKSVLGSGALLIVVNSEGANLAINCEVPFWAIVKVSNLAVSTK